MLAYAQVFWQVWTTRAGDHEETIWRRLAYATRYGHIPLSEAASLSVPDLVRFNRALDGIVHEENEPRGNGG